MPDGDLLDRVRDFLRGFERRQAERVVKLPGGFAVLSPRYAASHDHNKLCFQDGAGCATRFLLAAADDWPQVLYGRLGYAVIGSRPLFSRAG